MPRSNLRLRRTITIRVNADELDLLRTGLGWITSETDTTKNKNEDVRALDERLALVQVRHKATPFENE